MAGACVGAGSTHLAIMLANYFTNVYGLRTALVESGGQNDFLKICCETDRVRDDYRVFVYRNITFVAGEDNRESARILENAQVVVYDCGCGCMNGNVFKYADLRIAVLSASIYRVAKSLRLVSELGRECMYVCTFGGDAQMEKMARRAGVPVARIPTERDAFVLGKDTVRWIREAMAERINNL